MIDKLTANLDVETCLKNFKLISITQIDLSYVMNISPMVFKDPKVYANIQSDIQFINQIGTQLFNYFNQKDPSEQKIWYQALATGLTTAIADANALILLIPAGTTYGEDLKTVLLVLIDDYKAIQAILPPTEK